jgi:8-oxo-dGTP pyrophosphatase MutT (NUDIX family)
MSVSSQLSSKLPCQVAAVCYRRSASGIEFLLVNTDRGKWTFPKGSIEPHLSHSEAAAKEAWEEAGAVGNIDRTHFHVYLHAKGVFWNKPGIRELAVKAFLLEVHRVSPPEEPRRNPTWFSPEDAKIALRHRREIKYSQELSVVIELATREVLGRKGVYSGPLAGGPRSPLRQQL